MDLGRRGKPENTEKGRSGPYSKRLLLFVNRQATRRIHVVGKKLHIELPEGEVERHPSFDEDDEWGIKTEWPQRLPPKSDDFKRKPKHVRRRTHKKL